MRARALAVLAAGALLATGCGGAAPRRHAGGRTGGTLLRLGAVQRAVPRGFLGLSMEFQAVPAYTGTDPRAINPVLLTLVRNLSPGQPPVIRIGGDSTDASWVPAPGVTRPWFAGYSYRLTPSWLASTAAFAHDLGARLILGLDLAADEPALDAAEARAYLAAFGRTSVAALEIGNEPNLYRTIPEWTLASGRKVTARPRSFGPAAWRRELARTLSALPRARPGWTLAGPALAAGEQAAGAGRWTTSMPALLRAEPALRVLTVHRYPLKNCYTKPSSPQYPTIAHLLAAYSTTGLAAGVRPWVRIAAAEGRTVRIDELGSVACRGKVGVSDSFASALWVTDALFSLAEAGVGGVNIHTLPGAAYAPFTFSDAGGRWSAHVEPDYYGLELFAQAAPVGARLERVMGAEHTRSLSTWATRAPDGDVRLVLIDKDPGRARTVRVSVPAGATGPATLERLTAPAVSARSDVRLGGRSYGPVTRTGSLGAPLQTRLQPTRGEVTVRVPGASAAMLTFTR